jgi:hypothetical protein
MLGGLEVPEASLTIFAQSNENILDSKKLSRREFAQLKKPSWQLPEQNLSRTIRSIRFKIDGDTRTIPASGPVQISLLIVKTDF